MDLCLPFIPSSLSHRPPYSRLFLDSADPSSLWLFLLLCSRFHQILLSLSSSLTSLCDHLCCLGALIRDSLDVLVA